MGTMALASTADTGTGADVGSSPQTSGLGGPSSHGVEGDSTSSGTNNAVPGAHQDIRDVRDTEPSEYRDHEVEGIIGDDSSSEGRQGSEVKGATPLLSAETIADLPDLVLAEVFSHLAADDLLGAVPLVCRRFRDASRCTSVWRRVDLVVGREDADGDVDASVANVLRRAPALRLLDLHLLSPGEHAPAFLEALMSGVSSVSHLHMCRGDALRDCPGWNWDAFLRLLQRYSASLVWLRLMDCDGVHLHDDRLAGLLAALAAMPRLACLEYDYLAAGTASAEHAEHVRKALGLGAPIRRFRWCDSEHLAYADRATDDKLGDAFCSRARTRSEHRLGIHGPALARHVLRCHGAHLTEVAIVPNQSQTHLPADVRLLLAGCTQLRDLTVPVGDLDVALDRRSLRSLRLIGDSGPPLGAKRAGELSRAIREAADECFGRLSVLSLDFNECHIDEREPQSRKMILDLCGRCRNVRGLQLKGSAWRWELVEEVLAASENLWALCLTFVPFELSWLERLALFLPKLKHLTINSWQFSSRQSEEHESSTYFDDCEVLKFHRTRPDISYIMMYNLENSNYLNIM